MSSSTIGSLELAPLPKGVDVERLFDSSYNQGLRRTVVPLLSHPDDLNQLATYWNTERAFSGLPEIGMSHLSEGKGLVEKTAEEGDRYMGIPMVQVEFLPYFSIWKPTRANDPIPGKLYLFATAKAGAKNFRDVENRNGSFQWAASEDVTSLAQAATTRTTKLAEQLVRIYTKKQTALQS